MNSMLAANFKIGGDASVAAGPVGAGAKSDVTADLIAFSRAKGVYGGVNLDGTLVNLSDDWNKALLRQAGCSQSTSWFSGAVHNKGRGQAGRRTSRGRPNNPRSLRAVPRGAGGAVFIPPAAKTILRDRCAARRLIVRSSWLSRLARCAVIAATAFAALPPAIASTMSPCSSLLQRLSFPRPRYARITSGVRAISWSSNSASTRLPAIAAKSRWNCTDILSPARLSPRAYVSRSLVASARSLRVSLHRSAACAISTIAPSTARRGGE